MRRCITARRGQARCRTICETVRDFCAGLLVFLGVCALAALEARSTQPAPVAAMVAQTSKAALQPRVATPSQMTSGALLVRPAGSGEKENFLQAPQLDTDVEIVVSGPIARAVVTQRFRNTGKDQVEGIYVFPLPGDAAVDALSMQIGERSIKGEIKTRAEARQLYAQARNTGARARLVEQKRANIFTNFVANIAPGETVTIRIEYQESLRKDDGITRLHFPMVVAPRYAPRPLAHGVSYNRAAGPHDLSADSGGTINPVSLQVKLDAGFPLGEIDSATHAITVKRLGTDGALLTLEEAQVPADRDFELSWKPKLAAQPTARLFRQDTESGNYLMAMITPPAQADAIIERPREVIFVVDTSGSMAGRSIVQAKQGLEMAIDRLGERDRFNIIAFDSGYESLFTKPLAADEQGKAIARHFVARLEANGSTELLAPLGSALKDADKQDSRRVRQVVLITDGAIANEQKLFSEIAVKRGRSRLFLIGIGSAPSSFLLRRAAEIGRGSFVQIPAGNRIAQAMGQFLTRLESPAITDLAINWPKGMRADASPAPLPDLYAGEPLVVSARADTLKGTLTVTGNFNGKPWTTRFDLDAAKPDRGVGKLWARNKIASLEARSVAGIGARKTDQAVEKIALEHHLVSRMTSLVAVDNTPAHPRPDGTPLASDEIPLNLPEGWVYEKTFADQQLHARQTRTPKTRSARAHTAPSLRTTARRLSARARAGVASEQKAGPLLDTSPAGASGPAGPDTATSNRPPGRQAGLAGGNGNHGAPAAPGDAVSLFSGRFGLVGFMALVFAAMSALTLGMWRHLSRTYTIPRRAGRGI